MARVIALVFIGLAVLVILFAMVATIRSAKQPKPTKDEKKELRQLRALVRTLQLEAARSSVLAGETFSGFVLDEIDKTQRSIEGNK